MGRSLAATPWRFDVSDEDLRQCLPVLGLRPAPSDAERALLRRQLGRLVAGAHQAPCRGFGYRFEREHLRGATWPKAFGRMIGALLDDADRPVLVHFDLWDGNILVRDGGAGPVVAGIIDAGRALHGDPVLAFPSLSVLSDRAKDPSFVVDDDFLCGYCEVAGPLVLTGALLVRLALYRTYLYLVMLIEVTPREMSGEQEHWRQTEVSAIISHHLSIT